MKNDLIQSFFSKYYLSEEEKKNMIELNLFKTYAKGTVLLKEGEYSKYNYFVIKGCLRAYYMIDGIEKTISFYLEEDAIFTESPVHGKASKYYIICEEDCVLLRTSRKEEEFFTKKFPKMLILCNEFIKKEIVQQQEKFNFYTISSPELRYINILKNKPQLTQRVAQYHIASYIGIKPESLSRIKKRISKAF
ncbi:MAG: Crp/Fnr family transcriptional regulator [Chitinophagales bacterium]